MYVALEREREREVSAVSRCVGSGAPVRGQRWWWVPVLCCVCAAGCMAARLQAAPAHRAVPSCPCPCLPADRLHPDCHLRLQRLRGASRRRGGLQGMCRVVVVGCVVGGKGRDRGHSVALHAVASVTTGVAPVLHPLPRLFSPAQPPPPCPCANLPPTPALTSAASHLPSHLPAAVLHPVIWRGPPLLVQQGGPCVRHRRRLHRLW